MPLFSGIYTLPSPKAPALYSTPGLDGVIAQVDVAQLAPSPKGFNFGALRALLAPLPKGMPFVFQPRWGCHCPTWLSHNFPGTILTLPPGYHRPEVKLFVPATWEESWTTFCLSLMEAAADWLRSEGLDDRLAGVSGVHQSWLDGGTLQFPWQCQSPEATQTNIHSLLAAGFSPLAAADQCQAYLQELSSLFPSIPILFAPRDAEGGQFLPPISASGTQLPHPNPQGWEPFGAACAAAGTNLIFASIGRPGQSQLPDLYTKAAKQGCTLGGQFIVPPFPRTLAELLAAGTWAVEDGCRSLQLHPEQISMFPSAPQALRALLSEEAGTASAPLP